MKRTLVLAVDRDDDFGVKGGVISPVIGIDNCITAANSLGIADPEDSDLNALYAAISTCMELQNDGIDVEVALICGNEKVGHKSDLALVEQLESVMDQIEPDNVVLVGDGAEDEYIFPIISSRSHVDSVRKVFVKQAPNIESSFYIISKMLSEPNKKKRFIAPIGYIILLLGIFLFIPDIVWALSDGNRSSLSSIYRDIVIMIVGIAVLFYAYDVSDKWDSFKGFVKNELLANSTRLIMTTIAIGLLIISIFYAFQETSGMYFSSRWLEILYFFRLLVWPMAIAIIVFIIGKIIDDYQSKSVMYISNIYDCITLGCFALVLMGLFDILLSYSSNLSTAAMGTLEICMGVAFTVIVPFAKRHLYGSDDKSKEPSETEQQ